MGRAGERLLWPVEGEVARGCPGEALGEGAGADPCSELTSAVLFGAVVGRDVCQSRRRGGCSN